MRPERKKLSDVKYRIKTKKGGDMTDEQILKMIKGDCYLCGCKMAWGIDRVSNERYDYGQTLPCCSFCNTIKGQKSLTELRSHIKKINKQLNKYFDI